MNQGSSDLIFFLVILVVVVLLVVLLFVFLLAVILKGMCVWLWNRQLPLWRLYSLLVVVVLQNSVSIRVTHQASLPTTHLSGFKRSQSVKPKTASSNSLKGTAGKL